jgi:hypothetical protein
MLRSVSEPRVVAKDSSMDVSFGFQPPAVTGIIRKSAAEYIYKTHPSRPWLVANNFCHSLQSVPLSEHRCVGQWEFLRNRRIWNTKGSAICICVELMTIPA